VWLAAVFSVSLALMVPQRAQAYSVLAHEAAIDAAWDRAIEPLLKRRFPNATPDSLLRARAFAYGGSVIQDLGYYPFGSRFFSNLLHYVRSGDFVEALLRDAKTLDELSFAIGALAHYANDNTGHPEAVNLAVPLAFPKLRVKYGDVVTYVDAPKQHVIVEFSFDVVQAAGGAYLPETYQRFVGFRVATDLLQRAFAETYGLEMRNVFADMDRSITTYRYAVNEIIPALTTAAWREKRDEIVRLHPGLEQRRFVFAPGKVAFEREYGSDYQKPGLFARFLGVLYRIVPKIGPLAPLSFKTPSAEAEALFARSFRDATSRLETYVRDTGGGRLQLANTNFDTGKTARHGDYRLADRTYTDLLERLMEEKFDKVPPLLQREILVYYGPNPKPVDKHERKSWRKTVAALEYLRQPQFVSRD
jgi:hypothetical protein